MDATLSGLGDALRAGDRAAFDAEVERHDREAGAAAAWRAAVARAARDHLLGRFDAAERSARQALAIGRSATSEPALPGLALQTCALQMLAIRREQGRLAELEPLLASRCRGLRPPRLWQIAWRWTQLAAGRSAPARELLRGAVADGGVEGDPRELLMLADLAVQLREPACGEAVRRALEPAREAHGAGPPDFCHAGSLARARGVLDGLLSRYSEAEQHFEEGLQADRALGALPFVARGLVEYGSALGRRGRPDDVARARELLDDGSALALELGMPTVVDAARRAAGCLRRSTTPEVGPRSGGTRPISQADEGGRIEPRKSEGFAPPGPGPSS